MNTGAFGENFPYSNFHDLNMDWIVKIARDFLDQYTHIQDLITEGEQTLNTATANGLEQLEDKAEALEALLQQWYNTHSEDIANELASALSSIGTALTSAINSFNASADAKTASAIASIPPDYTAMFDEVNILIDTINEVAQINILEDTTRYSGYLYPHYSTTKEANSGADCFDIIDVYAGITYYFRNAWGNFSCIKYNTGDYVSLVDGETGVVSGSITPAHSGQLMFTTPVNSRALLTTSKPLYDSGEFKSFNLYAIAESDNELLTKLTTYKQNILDDTTRYSGYLYPHYSTTREANSATDCYAIINITAGTTYYFKNAWGNFSCVKYASGDYVSLIDGETGAINGSFTSAQNGQLMFTTFANQEALLTTDETLYNLDVRRSVSIINDPFRRIFKVEKDGSGDFFRLTKALEYINNTGIMDAIIYVGDGIWDIVSELGNSGLNAIDSTNRGPVLKNRVHLIFSSKSKVVCNYTGTRELTMRWLSPFNSGEYGFTLENCRIEASKCLYAFHDERNQDTDFYTNKFINCSMYIDNTNNTGANSHQCIGGGLGTNGHIIIENCNFQSINGTYTPSTYNPVSYHNSEASGVSRIDISGVYMANGTVRLDWYGASTEKTKCYVHDCSFTHSIINEAETPASTNQNMEVIEWNNEIRN